MASAPGVVRSSDAGQNPLELVEPSPVRIPLEVGPTTLPNAGHLLFRSVDQGLDAEGWQGLEAAIVVQQPPCWRQELRPAGIQAERGDSRCIRVAECYDRRRTRD